MSHPNVTGRFAQSEPKIQNLPGSLADSMDMAFETNNWSPVWNRLGEMLQKAPIITEAPHVE